MIPKGDILVTETFISGVLVALLQLLVGFALSVTAVYIGISLVDRLTGGVRHWSLIKKGNVAVGILYAAIVFSLMLMIQPSIDSTVMSLSSTTNPMSLFAANLLVMVISLLTGVLLVYLLLRIIDMISADVEEINEITKGNVAVALITASALIAVSFIMQTTIKYLVYKLTLIS
jgi:uncharacterized membrane protein YjfL (UPF0719 family)